MKDDPIVEEIRRYRQEHEAQFNHDPDRIVEDLVAQQRASGRTYIRLPARRIKPEAEGVSNPKPADEPAGTDGDVSGTEVTNGKSRRMR